jgi:hypothetical protein
MAFNHPGFSLAISVITKYWSVALVLDNLVLVGELRQRLRIREQC